ncbi:MAG: hypothetical protein IJ215_03565 [Clostridia bacterium]|nr:hypothetical protein [Clostridia bacterium]
MKTTNKSNPTPIDTLEVVNTKKPDKKPNGPVSTPMVVHVHNHNRVRNVVRFSLLMPVLLLVLRHYLPEIEQDIPYVYQFLDRVMIPIIEWAHKLGLKAINWLTAQEWVANVIQTIANLAV